MGKMKEEEIRSAIEGVSREALADALAIVLAEGSAPSQAAAGMTKPDLSNFAQAVMYLKKNYGFEELDLFTTEADLVYVQAGDRRVLLTDRMNGPARPMPGQGRPSPEESGQASTPAAGADSKNTPPDDEEGGRFSHLELWE